MSVKIPSEEEKRNTPPFLDNPELTEMVADYNAKNNIKAKKSLEQDAILRKDNERPDPVMSYHYKPESDEEIDYDYDKTTKTLRDNHNLNSTYGDGSINTIHDVSQGARMVRTVETETPVNYGEKITAKNKRRVGAVATLLKKLGIGVGVGGFGFMVASGPILEGIEDAKQKALEDSVRIKNEETIVGAIRPNELPDNPTAEQIQEYNDAMNIYSDAQEKFVDEDGSIEGTLGQD